MGGWVGFSRWPTKRNLLCSMGILCTESSKLKGLLAFYFFFFLVYFLGGGRPFPFSLLILVESLIAKGLSEVARGRLRIS